MLEFSKPSCLHPTLLLNRAALNLLDMGHSLYCGDLPIALPRVRHHAVTTLPIKFLFSLKNTYPIDQLHVDYQYTLFIYVPCRKCHLCRTHRQSDLSTRAMLHQSASQCPPFFITLTYRDADLFTPLNPLGDLHYRDIQLFFKRLRRIWDRRGLSHHISYLVSGEYGKRTHRAHWHLILFDNPYGASDSTPSLFRQLRDDVFKAWSHCDMSGFDFDVCRDYAVLYTTKYVSKSNKKYHHKSPPIVRTSLGLGLSQLRSHIPYLRSNPALSNFNYRTFDGLLTSSPFTSYVSHHVYPSPLSTIPSTVRLSYRLYLRHLSLMVDYDIISREHAYKRSILYLPFYKEHPRLYAPKDFTFVQPHAFRCPTMKRFFIYRCYSVLYTLESILYDHHDKCLDADYCELYQEHQRLSSIKDSSADLVQRSVAARQRLASIRDIL